MNILLYLHGNINQKEKGCGFYTAAFFNSNVIF